MKTLTREQLTRRLQSLVPAEVEPLAPRPNLRCYLKQGKQDRVEVAYRDTHWFLGFGLTAELVKDGVLTIGSNTWTCQ